MRRVGVVFALLAAVTMASAEPAKQAEPTAKAKEQAKEQPKEKMAKPAAKAAKGAEKVEVSKAILDSYNAIPLAERVAIQSDLIWTGDYNGVVSGEFGDRSIAAVKAFQKRNGGNRAIAEFAAHHAVVIAGPDQVALDRDALGERNGVVGIKHRLGGLGLLGAFLGLRGRLGLGLLLLDLFGLLFRLFFGFRLRLRLLGGLGRGHGDGRKQGQNNADAPHGPTPW